MTHTRTRFLTLCLLTLVLAAASRAANITFRVQVPASTPIADTVYIAGSFQGWNPASAPHALTRQLDGTYQITLSLPSGTPIQFKFTRGSWATVEKGPSGEEVANRTYTPAADATVNLTVARWADGSGSGSTIVGHVETFTYAPFLGGRKIWVYLPPDYSSSTDTYPVLYMHDGQNLFDVTTSFAGEWKIDETCENLISTGQIPPIIVVGIENGAARCNEYTPYATGNLSCGGGASAYLSAVRDILIPRINQLYRTKTGPANTYTAGSSLGGVLATYAGYAFSDTFGRVAALSPSYWAQAPLYTLATNTGRPGCLTHFYQDMGTIETGSIKDSNQNGIDDYIETLRQMKTIALAQGFVENIDFKSVEAAGHQHNEFYWSQRMPAILKFLIPPDTSVAITAQSGATSAIWSTDVSLNVTVQAGVPVTYTWKRDGVAVSDGPTAWGSTISGSHTAQLTIAGVHASDQASYTCTVAAASIGCASAASAPIALTITCPADLDGVPGIDLGDYFFFLNCFDVSDPCADVDNNPGVDLGDFFLFLSAFDQGCV